MAILPSSRSVLLVLPLLVGFWSSGALAQRQTASGEVLVKFRPGVSPADIAAVNQLRGASTLGTIPELGVHRIAVPTDRTASEMAELYRQDPGCEYAEPNHVGRGGDFVPDDTYFSLQWHLENSFVADADIAAVQGWQITRGSSSVVVAILDSGIDTDHPEFQGRLLPGFDFVNEDADPEDDEAHGTQVAGLLAANADNAFSVAGVDHAAQILPVKVLDADNSGTTFDLAQGLVFAADEGAHVISMSLIDYPLSSTLNDALQFARDAGSVLVACAGNGGLGDADLSGPGASPLTISVGATQIGDTRAGFSGTGAALDIVAPGDGVATTVFDSHQDNFSLFVGCSAATPLVAGVSTLLLSLDPSLTHDDVRAVLTSTADDQVGPPQEDTPGRDDFFGHGRLNMLSALLALAPLEVLVDIRPGSDVNFINPLQSELVPVAILGSETFDVADVDPTTLAFGPAGAAPDGAAGYLDDVNDDTFTDLVSFYQILETGIAFRDPEACVTGETVGGTPFEGCDAIRALLHRCGLGVELSLLLVPLMWLRRRRRWRPSSPRGVIAPPPRS